MPNLGILFVPFLYSFFRLHFFSFFFVSVVVSKSNWAFHRKKTGNFIISYLEIMLISFDSFEKLDKEQLTCGDSEYLRMMLRGRYNGHIVHFTMVVNGFRWTEPCIKSLVWLRWWVHDFFIVDWWWWRRLWHHIPSINICFG